MPIQPVRIGVALVAKFLSRLMGFAEDSTVGMLSTIKIWAGQSLRRRLNGGFGQIEKLRKPAFSFFLLYLKPMVSFSVFTEAFLDGRRLLEGFGEGTTKEVQEERRGESCC